MKSKLKIRFLMALVTFLIAALVVNVALADAGDTTRVSVSTAGDQGNASANISSSISSDGRYVVFQSDASNLVARDTNNAPDIFVRDRQTNTTTRVSVASDGTQANGPAGGPSGYFPVITPDGRYVAFASAASNLVGGGIDTNMSYDIFVHDMQTGVTTWESTTSDGQQGELGDCFSPSISADGRYVVFSSDLHGLVPDDTNMSLDIFIRDRQAHTTRRISVSSDGVQANHVSDTPFISANGRYVVFQSLASNLVNDDTNGSMDIFLHDLQTNVTTRISVAADGTQGNGSTGWPSISADGRYILFGSDSSNLVSGDTNGKSDIFVRDQQTNTIRRVSVALNNAQANGDSDHPSISDDGRRIAFSSFANNLISGDTNGKNDIFIYDQQAGLTTRVSVASDGTQPNNMSNYSSISGNGRFIAFWSLASNLVDGDTNETWDIFVHENAAPAPVTVKKTFISDAGKDGWLLESNAGSNVGGALNTTDSGVNLGGDAAKRQYRSILSFNTASIPDNATVTGVVLKVKQYVRNRHLLSNLQNLMIDVKNGFFGSAAVLQPADFQEKASGTYGPFNPVLTNNVYGINLVGAKANINKLTQNGGLTQIRLRFMSNTVVTYLSLYSGDAVVTADRPQLVITYTIP